MARLRWVAGDWPTMLRLATALAVLDVALARTAAANIQRDLIPEGLRSVGWGVCVPLREALTANASFLGMIPQL